MKIFIIAGYLVALALQNVNAQCPFAGCPQFLLCSNDTKPGQIVDSNGCLLWTCVPNQALCCPRTSIDDLKCEGEWEPSQIMDLKTGCNIWTCVPKQPNCCPLTYPTQKCPRDFYNFQVYDRKTGCLFWTCVPGCEKPPPKTVCANGFKLGHVYKEFDSCLSWACVPNQPICCRQTSPDAIHCPIDSEPGLVMDPSTGCENWQCVPKQPYCCREYSAEPASLEVCIAPKYSIKVYDEKTGCYVWECREEILSWLCGTIGIDIPIKLG